MRRNVEENKHNIKKWSLLFGLYKYEDNNPNKYEDNMRRNVKEGKHNIKNSNTNNIPSIYECREHHIIS